MVYLPIQKGERISNVWVRSFKNLKGIASRPSIVVNLPLTSMSLT